MRVYDKQKMILAICPLVRGTGDADNAFRAGILISAHHDGCSKIFKMRFDGRNVISNGFSVSNVHNFAWNIVQRVNNEAYFVAANPFP